MDKPEARGNEPGRDGLKKCAAVSTEGEPSSKAARTKASSSTRRWEDISVLRRHGSENKEVELE